MPLLKTRVSTIARAVSSANPSFGPIRMDREYAMHLHWKNAYNYTNRINSDLTLKTDSLHHCRYIRKCAIAGHDATVSKF